MDRKKIIKIVIVIAVIAAVIVGLSMLRGTPATVPTPASN